MSKDGAVQFFLFFFRHQTETCFMENLQSQKVFWLCCESMLFFNVTWVEVRKMTEILWAKLYYKTTDLFWLWDFLLEDLKFKKLWWCPKKVACPKKYIQKTNTKDEILNHSYFGPNFVFGGTALARFSQYFFFFFQFSPSTNHGGQHFYWAPHPHHKKASYGHAESIQILTKKYWKLMIIF